MDNFMEIVNSNKAYFGYPSFLTKLFINDQTPIYYLEELRMLKEIYIQGDNEYIKNGFIDYSSLNSFSNLVSLIINNNPNIESLDVTGLKKLQVLILVNNRYLRELKGLDELNCLRKVIIVGNKVRKINNFSCFLNNNKNANIMKFDLNMFHYFDKSDIMVMENMNVDFAEKISVGQFYNLSLDKVSKLYQKGLSIVSDMPEDLVSFLRCVYLYLIKNTVYDYDMLEKRNSYILNGNRIGIYVNDYKDCNSSYNAIMKNKAVCEGYANALQFLANIRYIDIENIICFFKNSNQKFEYYNHTASRVKINGEWYYLDAQVEDDANDIKYFLLTRENFSKSHKLIFDEIEKVGGEDDTVITTKYKR